MMPVICELACINISIGLTYITYILSHEEHVRQIKHHSRTLFVFIDNDFHTSNTEYVIRLDTGPVR